MFVKLAQKARPAEKRIKKRISAMSPLEFGQESREAEKTRLQAEEVRKTATEQLIHASGRVPKKARTRLAMMSFSGRIARQDAERAEKSRWLALLATLLAGTDTPLGRRLVEKPAACNSMGLCLRSGTLRNRVNALRRYFTWLASSYRVPFPCVEEHVLDYLELKVQEPCTRVSLKVVHQTLVYLEEISEISPEARLTVRPRYSNLLAELLSQTKPGSEPRQAPRPLVKVLEAIERTVVDYREPVVIRLYAWFYLLQTWCSLGFDDHRGLEPGLLRNTETSLTGVLTRSKTHGPDKRIQRKPVFLDKGCWFAVKNWCELAPCERDYLLPSPGHNHAGIREAEMSYDAGLATTTSLHRGLVANGQQLPSTGPLTLPGRSWLRAVQRWESQKLNATCWAGGHRTSQTHTLGSSAHLSRNSNCSSCQSSVAATISVQSWEKESLCKNLKFSSRKGVSNEKLSRRSSRGWTKQGPHQWFIPKPQRAICCRRRSKHLKKKSCSWALSQKMRSTWSFASNRGAKPARTSRKLEHRW